MDLKTFFQPVSLRLTTKQTFATKQFACDFFWLPLRMSATVFPEEDRGNVVLAAASISFGLKYVDLERIPLMKVQLSQGKLGEENIFDKKEHLNWWVMHRIRNERRSTLILFDRDFVHDSLS